MVRMGSCPKIVIFQTGSLYHLLPLLLQYQSTIPIIEGFFIENFSGLSHPDNQGLTVLGSSVMLGTDASLLGG